MDYKRAVEEKKAYLAPLTSRMDTDRELVELDQYVLRDVNDKEIPNAINVTLNDPGTFATNVESSLGSSTEQVTVESDSRGFDSSEVEEFIKAAFAAADQRLIKTGQYLINPYIDQQMCRRGRGAARCLFRKDSKTGQIIPGIVPLDTRYLYYEIGFDGLAWGGYETVRTKDMIKSEYPKASPKDDTAVVLDVWDTEHNEVWVDDEQVSEKRHNYGYTPIVLQMVPIGSMLADKDSLAHQGESIFFLIRDLVPQLNRLVSIIQSLNMKALDNALLWKSQEGILATPPDYDELTAPGSTTPADIGGGAEPVSYGKLKQEAWLLHEIIETRIQRGSLSSIDLGTLEFPMSAVALVQIGEGRDVVFLPRLGARGLLKQRLAEMFIDQIIKTGDSTVEIGTPGHKRKFDVGKLKGDYDISFKYFIKSPKIDVARFSMAAAAGDLIPNRSKRRDILQREDPEEDERWLRWEEAERLSPGIKMNRTVKALIEMAEDGDKDAELEAEIMSAEMGVNLEQMLRGDTEQQLSPQGEQKPVPMLPMFSGGGGNKGGVKAQAPPVEREGE